MTTPDTEPQPDIKTVAAEIAGQLGETQRVVIHQIRGIVKRLGPDKAQEFLAETLAIDAAGGLPTSSGRRQRSRGGIFFHLIRRSEYRKRRREPAASFTWLDRLAIVPTLLEQTGASKTVKITRPGSGGRFTPAHLTQTALET